jgi:hypothetical protein
MPLKLCRVGFIRILIPIVAVSVSVHASQATQRWYDTYDEGIKAVQAGDWATAEQRLLAARSRGPKPGRRVLRYGSFYGPFLPDYYLGIVYLNTGRPQEAEAEFAKVKTQELIGPKDPENSAFQNYSQQATADRLLADAKQVASAQPPVPSTNPVSTPPIRVPTALPPTTGDYNPGGAVGATTDSKADQPPMVQGPIQPTGPPTTPQGAPASASAAPSVVTGARKGPVASDATGVSSPSLRSGLVAFFSGDYVAAIQWLERATQEAGGPPRAQLYLACAKAGLVLTGGGNADLLRTARLEFQSADPRRNLPDAQRRFISPRVLEQLEKP